MRTHSHELHSEIEHWTIPKILWDERIHHLCDTKRVEDGKKFLLNPLTYSYIISHFQKIYHATNLSDLLTQQNYGDLVTFLLMLFELREKNPKEIKVIHYPLKV